MDLIKFTKEKNFKLYKSCIITIFIVNLKDEHFMFYFIYCLKSFIINFFSNFYDKKNNFKMKKIVTAIHNFQLSSFKDGIRYLFL